jgi:hypothetical protein
MEREAIYTRITSRRLTRRPQQNTAIATRTGGSIDLTTSSIPTRIART